MIFFYEVNEEETDKEKKENDISLILMLVKSDSLLVQHQYLCIGNNFNKGIILKSFSRKNLIVLCQLLCVPPHQNLSC